MHRSHLLLTACCGLLLGHGAKAADVNPAEAKLRETLRTTMLQLRTVQGDFDNLQAEKAAWEEEKKGLAAKAETLSKQLAADKEAADRSIAALNDRVSAQTATISQLNTSLEKWKASQQQAVAIIQTKESARAALAQEAIELKRKVADQQTRNQGMYKVAREILTRYENFGLGTAIAAREPFTGNMRVKLENLVQDLSDKADAERIKPDRAAGTGR